MNILRGEIYLADLPKEKGSVQSGQRPVIIIQNNKGNLYSPTTFICPFTKQKKKMPTHVLIPNSISGLPLDSYVMVESGRAIDKSCLIRKIGQLPEGSTFMKEIEKAIKFNLGMVS